MKFTCTVEIARPRDEVVALFQDPTKLGEYQKDFLRKELVSGSEWEEGAVSRLYYKFGKREMELTETIVSNTLPEAFLGAYHHMHMDNTMRSVFTELDEGRTRYDAEVEYTEFRGFMPKLMSFLFPGLFKKQVQKWLNNFKEYAERS